MGYLNSDTIVVDAILTKHARKLMAQGQGPGITKFALSDDGIDYSLWNPDHPSGSASYGVTITSLPQLEASPDDFTVMTYKLTSLDRNRKYLPYIELASGEKSITFGRNSQGTLKRISFITRNMSGAEQYDVLLTDSRFVNLQGGTQRDISSTIGNAAPARDLPSPILMRGTEFTLTPLVREGVDHVTTLKVSGVESDANFIIKIKVVDNLLR